MQARQVETALMAFPEVTSVVSRTGRAKDFFLPGLLANAGYALAYAISIALVEEAKARLTGLLVVANRRLTGAGPDVRVVRSERFCPARQRARLHAGLRGNEQQNRTGVPVEPELLPAAP